MFRIGIFVGLSLTFVIALFAACSSASTAPSDRVCHGGCLCFGSDLEACAAGGCYPTISLDGGAAYCAGNGGPVTCGFGEISTGRPPPNCGIITATDSAIPVVTVDGGFCCANWFADAGASADAALE